MSTATASRYFTVKQIADQYAVTVHKVLAWIEAGELNAINIARNPQGQPRYRVSAAALEAFENSRSSRRS